MAQSRFGRLILAASLAAVLPGAARAQAEPPASDTQPPPPPDPADEPQATEAPPDALPPPQPLDLPSAQQQLSQYGRWIDTPEYGRVWVPASASPDWQPYTDGRWVYTQWGWSFAPDVPWGGIVFHYGRWGFLTNVGWFWVPGTVWAPAWVSWRYTNGYVSWAPYGPRGYVYPRGWRGWAVVPEAHFTHPVRREVMPMAHGAPIVRQSQPVRSIDREPRHGVVYGPSRQQVPHAWSRGGGGRGGGGARAGGGGHRH